MGRELINEGLMKGAIRNLRLRVKTRCASRRAIFPLGRAFQHLPHVTGGILVERVCCKSAVTCLYDRA